RQKTDDSDPGLYTKTHFPTRHMIHNNIQLHKHNTDELRRKGAPAGGRGGGDALHTAAGLSARTLSSCPFPT
ncbi:hypothetical protein XENOCAPTIV_003822, partial [Xenoophorus captivus]